MLKPGDRIGDWVVEAPLGEGGMGAVYRVHSALTDRLLAALKILKPMSDDEARARFVREAEALSSLSHPGVVRVMSFGEDPRLGLRYLAMELAVGETLRARLHRGPLTEVEAVSAFAPLASALEHIHGAGIFHRDVKPSNIVLCRDGSVKLVDFGIAAAQEWETLTTGGHLGTLPYLPPEIFRGERPDPRATDVYAFGLILHEALSGMRPFPVDPGLPPAAVAAAIGMKKIVQAPFDLGEPFPQVLRDAVRQATDPDPVRRPHMRVLREAIDSLRAVMSERRGRPLAPFPRPEPHVAPPAKAVVADHTMRVPEPDVPLAVSSRRRLRRPGTRTLLAVGAGALLLGAALVSILGRGQNTPPAAAAVPPPARGLTAGDVWTNEKDGMPAVWIPPGHFVMGCTPGDAACDPGQLPSREVTFATGFWLWRTEVTVDAYRRFAADTGRRMPAVPDFNADWVHSDHPIVNVSWSDAKAYCAWAGGRLPSEAEWEYAARGGHGDRFYPWGKDEPVCRGGAANGARFDDGTDCRKSGTERVAAYGPNGWGLMDMGGNAWEWCADEWSPNYSDAPSDGSAFEEGAASRRVLRGGSWVNGGSYLRVSIRSRWFEESGRSFIGLRCARDAEDKKL